MRRGLIAIAALGAMLALPGHAAAKAGTYTIPASRHARFSFPGTHGFKIEVEVLEGREREGTSLSINLSHGSESAGYYAQTRVRFARDDSVSARLPGVGELALSFEPKSSETLPLGRRCRGEAPTIAHGVFRGEISLRGRRGFTEAHRSAVRGTVTERPRQVCRFAHHRHHRHESAPITPEETASLSATGRTGGTSALFSADETTFAGEPTAPTFIVFATSFAHGVSFTAFGGSGSGKGVFDVPDLRSLSTATVSPSAPFTGSAEYAFTAPRRRQWTGDLAVELPGFGRLPLTGPQFQTELCVGSRCTSVGHRSGGGFIAVSTAEVQEIH